MGLGKTVQALALIAADPTGAGIVTNPTPLDPSFCSATLIVCPLSVIGKYADAVARPALTARSWQDQIKEHAPDLRTYLYVREATRRLC